MDIASFSSPNRTVEPGKHASNEWVSQAERELGAFLAVVAESFGQNHVRPAADYWIRELEALDIREEQKGSFRQVTIAASMRLAGCMTAAADTKVSPIPSSDCVGLTRLP